MKNALIAHPGGGFVFGTVKGVVLRHITITQGSVFLRQGEERGASGSFGAEHIWHRHGAEMARLGYTAKADVPRFVADIIRPATRVYCEFSQMRGAQRLIALRGRQGAAVLKEITLPDQTIAYSIITAYPNPRVQGQLVTVII